MPVIPGLERRKQENKKFKVTHPHIGSSSQPRLHETLTKSKEGRKRRKERREGNGREGKRREEKKLLAHLSLKA